MLQIGGIVVLFGCVFGGYLMTGGSLSVVFEALPHEMATIFGAAIAAMLIAGSIYNLKKIGGSLGQVISGPRWKPKDYQDLLCLLFLLTKTMKSKGLIALEAHIEKPSESSIFKRYPKITKDHFALDFICDTLRMMTMSLEDPHQVETNMEKQLEKHHHEALIASNALTAMSDGLPALGIVAAVLGVIHTMGSITEPPAVLGGLIGSALVGTFLGVFLSYGFVAPIAAAIKARGEAEERYFLCIKAGILAYMQGYAPSVAVEFARKALNSDVRPTFYEVEEAVDALPAAT